MSCSQCGPCPTYTIGIELPDLTIPALRETIDGEWEPIDYTAGWSFIARIGEPNRPAIMETTNVVGFDGGVTISFAPGDLDSVRTGLWEVHVVATQVSDSRTGDVWACVRFRHPVLAQA